MEGVSIGFKVTALGSGNSFPRDRNNMNKDRELISSEWCSLSGTRGMVRNESKVKIKKKS